ncbi:Peptidase_S8 domain-containing protein/PA domain-containing protein/Inhibitor_I9 domain-containing protein, partial [Cephalotus follicularis]
MHSLFHQLLFLSFLIGLITASGYGEKKFYIVFLGDEPVNKEYAIQTHMDMLSSVKESDLEAEECMVYSYTKGFNAFAAKLSNDDVEKLSNMDNVLAVLPNRYHKLHTTKSWDFLGLPEMAKRNLEVEGNIVVGLLDSGITPESESFNDKGFDPPPRKWKGTCRRFANFSGCNNKLIGARYFKLDGNPDPNDILSPIDVGGHGTHTASTLAGNMVKNASLFGLAKGVARGAVPNARVAMYKVCWMSSGCSDMDMLAAFDAAINDGVDVLSVSIGGESTDYVSDGLAIGAFHAMRKGIITVASAGNDGPSLGSVVNHAPWLLTVAASAIDRGFRSKVVLGNGKTVSGIGVSNFEPEEKLYPLIKGADAAKNSASKESARYCIQDSMDPGKVKGRLVYCILQIWGADSVVKGIGGRGTIIESPQFLDTAQIFMAPATIVNATVGEIVSDYIQSTRSPSAVIHRTEEVEVPAPFIASFSSRGPNPGSDRILKPDIAAPGIDILASYTPLNSLTGLKGDTQHSKFTLMSGTSMACPHVAGAAAYVKSFHPNWTAAAVKSALMTTAKSLSRRVNNDGEFAYGVGQLNPAKAISPGLVYDMDDMAYIQFLCHEGYKGSSFAPLIGTKSINCSSLLPGLGYDAINYPTMQLKTKNSKKPIATVFRRRVTNVGPSVSIYNAIIKAPSGVNITVKPMSLSFTHTLQKRSFKVVVKAQPMSTTLMLSGSLVWQSSSHIVRSPIETTLPQLLYTYQTVITGFAAKLSPKQLRSLKKIDGFVSATPDEILTLHTTHTPQFLGLEIGKGLWNAPNLASDVVIGIIDTGIWPEHISFEDSGMSPVPSNWKGACEEGTNFSKLDCNKKLIGARAFFKGYEIVAGKINETEDYLSARDSQGHGTHTASTAAGNQVQNVSLFGLARGSAFGMSYTSRIAAYKVCWRLGCSSSDVLAAIDKAVDDGVDVLSLSLGSSSNPYYSDNMAIALFGAIRRGIFVSCSAGNSGPSSSSVCNTAPWIMTVAASSIDRSFPTTVKLGDGQTFKGSSLYPGKAITKLIPLVYGKTAGGQDAAYCTSGSLNEKLVKGKIVVCQRGSNSRAGKGVEVKLAGGAGMLLINSEDEGEELFADPHVLPATSLGATAGKALKTYLSSANKPTASIAFRGTTYRNRAPVMAAFSSRGPNLVGPDVIKPDVTAPGMNILAAWPPITSPTELSIDKRRVLFNIASGTSMSCPHVSGIAALLKSVHKDWSPAAIKSALMTTAYTHDNKGAPIADVAFSNSISAKTFAFGSGHVDPERASDPGLIYDITTEDYLNYMCSLNYTSSQISEFSKGSSFTCPNLLQQPGDLNYPSFSVIFDRKARNVSVTYKRTVTNVGLPKTTYAVQLHEPNGVAVIVQPKTLKFKNVGHKLSYTVSFVALKGATLAHSSFGSLAWVSGRYQVRSPI